MKQIFFISTLGKSQKSLISKKLNKKVLFSSSNTFAHSINSRLLHFKPISFGHNKNKVNLLHITKRSSFLD